ncbi:uncharacterized protein LOC119682561 [Teleopsis dalmanni]|uniref:uncharacterized protein LOC119678867 n=1 Tax=Teleopsis dalmanni TaxID=139649 RepID=UPI0018CCED56|nr:uncharacterized protein LOC119678867 [Teleopsis dalmanni]XP_037951500.1 uncharacterized protein LOC119682203 [Teleopsis dalmanni]XP_037951959.1 uncharacterized protein LOC119682561 [Teleopsis dalmanni]
MPFPRTGRTDHIGRTDRTGRTDRIGRNGRNGSNENLEGFSLLTSARAQLNQYRNVVESNITDHYGCDRKSIGYENGVDDAPEHDWFKLEAEENEKLLDRAYFIKFITNTDTPKKGTEKDGANDVFTGRMNRRADEECERNYAETVGAVSNETDSTVSTEYYLGSSCDDENETILSAETTSKNNQTDSTEH